MGYVVEMGEYYVLRNLVGLVSPDSPTLTQQFGEFETEEALKQN